MKYIQKVKNYFRDIRIKSAMKNYLDRYIELAQFIMTNGSGVNIQDIKKYLTDIKDNEEMVRFMIKKLKKCDFTVLMYAAIREDEDLISNIISNHLCGINKKDRLGYTALMYACRFNKSDRIVKMLLENGADVNNISKRKKTAFNFAKDNGNDIIISVVGRAILNDSIPLVAKRTREVRFSLD